MERRKKPGHRLLFLHDQLASYYDTCVPTVWWHFHLLFNLIVEVFVFISGINWKSKKHVKNNDVPSAIKPVSHGPGIHVPEPTGDISEIKCSSSTESKASEQDTWNAEQSTKQPKPLKQLELNDLT